MATVNLSNYDPNQVPDASDMKFGIVVSDWNSEVTHALLQGAYDTLVKHGAEESNIRVYHVPGSFELVYASKKLCDEADVDAVIALGCVVRGGTPHFDYVCQSVTQGVAALNTQGKVPVIFSVLTVLNKQQALDRCGGKLGNKGIEGAYTAIRMANL